MKNIKFILFLLTMPFLLVCMKIEDSKMEREKKRRNDLTALKSNDLLVAMNTGKDKEIN
ncbi:hypothetical protein [Sinomicrobium sp. M5D2P17]